MLFYSFYNIRDKDSDLFYHYKNNDTFAEINCENEW